MNAKSNLPEAWFAKADADLQGVHPSFVALTLNPSPRAGEGL